MIDMHGFEIRIGQKVKTRQYHGGVLPPADPCVGIVEEATNAFGKKTLKIRFRETCRDFDEFILLENRINEIIN